MRVKTISKITALFNVMLFGAILSITVLNCDDSGEGAVGSAFMGVITITDESGQIIGGSDEDWCNGDGSPGTFALFPAYPNPANGTTIIRFDIPRPCHVKISIHNVYKGHVETLMDHDLPSGMRQVAWDASGYNSGLYWCYMWAEDFECSGRILIIQ